MTRRLLFESGPAACVAVLAACCAPSSPTFRRGAGEPHPGAGDSTGDAVEDSAGGGGERDARSPQVSPDPDTGRASDADDAAVRRDVDDSPSGQDGGGTEVPPEPPRDTGPEPGDVAQGEYVWDDSRLGEPCETLFDECGAGNLCLADITCGPTPDDWECTRHMAGDPDHYRCQRKCTDDAHCQDLGRHCVAWFVGNGENNSANQCVALCMPLELEGHFNPLDEEDCRSSLRGLGELTGPWPPPP